MPEEHKRYYGQRETYEFDENGVWVKLASGSHGFVVWPDIQMVKSGKDFVRIHQSRRSVFLIPESAWSSPSDQDAFLELVRQKGLLK